VPLRLRDGLDAKSGLKFGLLNGLDAKFGALVGLADPLLAFFGTIFAAGSTCTAVGDPDGGSRLIAC
jgi:hypothetical protein